MGAVMIRCPRTGGPVSTAIEIEAADFKRLPTVAAWLLCPLCGHEHTWTAREAWLEEPGSAPRAVVRPETV